MKKFYALLLSSILAAGAADAGIRVKTIRPAEGAVAATVKQRATLAAGAERSARHAVKRAAASEEPIVTPQGTPKLYEASCKGYTVLWGYVFPYQDSGLAAELVFDQATGDVYFKNPVSMLVSDTYIKGHGDEHGITFSFPQVLAYEGTEPVYVNKMVYKDLEDNEATYVVDTENNSVSFAYQDGKIVMEGSDDTVIIGVTNGDGDWYGYGDFNIVLGEFSGKAMGEGDLPAGATVTDMAMSYSGGGHMVKMATDGSDIYLGNISQYVKGGWVKGSVAEGKVTIPSGQYIGIDPENRHFSYFNGATVTVDEDPLPGDDPYTYTPADQAEMTVEGDIYKCTNAISIGFMMNGEYFNAEGYDQPQLRVQPAVISYVPAPPVINEYEAYDDEYGYGAIEFNVPNVNEDGYLLDTADLYWQLILDGKPYTFDPSQYIQVPAPMTDVPFGYTDYEDFFANGNTTTLFFYMGDYTRMGIRSVYKKDGDTYMSDIVYADSDGVGSVEADSPAVACEYFDMQGRRVADPRSGIYIKSVKHADGSVAVSKVAVR